MVVSVAVIDADMKKKEDNSLAKPEETIMSTFKDEAENTC